MVELIQNLDIVDTGFDCEHSKLVDNGTRSTKESNYNHIRWRFETLPFRVPERPIRPLVRDEGDRIYTPPVCAHYLRKVLLRVI